MPEENYQKIKLLKIMEILRQETDEEHPMTKVELAARLVGMNVSCSPRSLIRDIKLLNEQGYEIMERLIGHEKGFTSRCIPAESSTRSSTKNPPCARTAPASRITTSTIF